MYQLSLCYKLLIHEVQLLIGFPKKLAPILRLDDQIKIMKSRRQRSAYNSRPGLIIQDTLPSSNIVNKTCSTILSSTLSSFDKTSQSSIKALMKDARACETASTTFPKSATSEHAKTDARGLKSRVVNKPKLFRNDINFHSSENLDKISFDFGCEQKDCLLCSETSIVLGVKEDSAKIETVGDYNDFNAGVVVSDSSAVSVFAHDNVSCDCLREDHNSELFVNNNYAQPDCEIDSSQHSNCGKCPQDDPKIANSVAVNSPPRFRTVISNVFFVKIAGARSNGKLFTVPPFSSPDSSSETGLVAFSGWNITSDFASAMSSSSNLAMTLRKLK